MYNFENVVKYIFNMISYNIGKMGYILDHIEII